MSLDVAWPAPAPPLPSRPAAPRAARVRQAIIATIAAGFVAAAVGLGRPLASVGLAIILAVTNLAALRAGAVRSRPRLLGWAAAGLFLPWLAVRSSPWLLVPDVIAATVLVIIATSSRNGAAMRDSAAGYLRRSVRALDGAMIAPRRAFLGVQAELPTGWRQAIRLSVGPAALGVTIALGVAVVLASGDAPSPRTSRSATSQRRPHVASPPRRSSWPSWWR